MRRDRLTEQILLLPFAATIALTDILGQIRWGEVHVGCYCSSNLEHLRSYIYVLGIHRE